MDTELTICRNCLRTTLKAISRCPRCGDDDSSLVIVSAGYGPVLIRGVDVTEGVVFTVSD